LIGSYVAFKTSTRPPTALGGEFSPCRRCSENDTDPGGKGGAVLSIYLAECSVSMGAQRRADQAAG
jgi:hypothetical protein